MADSAHDDPHADGVAKEQPAPQPGGLEAPLAPSADPTKKTSHTSDPAAADPGNGAD